MSRSVHGHEVLEMLVDADKRFTKESLLNAVQEKFGSEARFHTCSAELLTAGELIDFLEAREKFIEKDGYITTEVDLMCEG